MLGADARHTTLLPIGHAPRTRGGHSRVECHVSGASSGLAAQTPSDRRFQGMNWADACLVTTHRASPLILAPHSTKNFSPESEDEVWGCLEVLHGYRHGYLHPKKSRRNGSDMDENRGPVAPDSNALKFAFCDFVFFVLDFTVSCVHVLLLMKHCVCFYAIFWQWYKLTHKIVKITCIGLL